MAKISPVSIKYSIVARVELTGMVERPDVIGAVFGQTEGLLGPDLELRELQKSGRVGRIDVDLQTKKGKTSGKIIIPSSMSKSETALIAASMETIDRVGPAEAKIKVTAIKDIRESKRDYIVKRAKELLEELMEEVPSSTELASEIVESIRVSDIEKYNGLPAGPDIEDADEIVIVEGRADVLNLLKFGIKNAIALNGAKAPPKAIIELAKEKEATLFLDGDRGGDLILKNLSSMAEINYVARAPDGKEVEELTQKEIIKALRSKEEWSEAPKTVRRRSTTEKPTRSTRQTQARERSPRTSTRMGTTRRTYGPRISDKEKDVLKGMTDELMGSRGAFILDDSLKVLGRVPTKELEDTLKNIGEPVFAIVMDGTVGSDLDGLARRKRVKYIVAKSKPKSKTDVNVITAKDL